MEPPMTTDPDPFCLVAGHDYDCAAASIRVRADRAGARVFQVEAKGVTVRVLAHDRAAADEAARCWSDSPQDNQLLLP
jgi:hypothetical protein